MIILPDRHIPRARILMPVHDMEWREPSRAMFKDQFGNPGIRTRFRLRARLNDGFIAWEGWFDDRADADAFLSALVSRSIRYERELWRLPNPEWHPGLGENLSYEFVTTTFLTTTGTSNTYNVPSDWDSSANTIECIGAGGAGAASRSSSGSKCYAAGGAGGGYGKETNMSLTPGGTATYGCGAAGTSTQRTTTGSNTGGTGGDTYFNAASYAAATVGGQGGAGGAGSTTTTVSAATGGAGKGATNYSGGNGGAITSTSSVRLGTGGGGAAGPNGAGAAGTSSASASNTSTAGGAGDAGSGGTAGAATSQTGTAAAAGNGTEFQVSPAYGSGGGGGGNHTSAGTSTASAGGTYGGGGGGNAGHGSNATGGPGKQGLIVVIYTPTAATFFPTNLAMIGM